MHSVQSVVFALIIKPDITVMMLHETEVIMDDISKIPDSLLHFLCMLFTTVWQDALVAEGGIFTNLL